VFLAGKEPDEGAADFVCGVGCVWHGRKVENYFCIIILQERVFLH
jgi:hypothetical protein